MSIIYFKGQFTEESDCRISLRDRAFRFGDGLFETMLVANGAVYDQQAHLARLQTGLQELRIQLDTSAIPSLCAELIKRNNIQHGIARIIISRGENAEGAVGYLPKSPKPYFIIETIAKSYPALKEITLWKSSLTAIPRPSFKTISALLYTLAMMEAEEHDCDNALLLDEKSHICETASGNIFWFKGGTLFTPAITLPFIQGTVRSKVLELWKGKCEQEQFTVDTLQSAEEIFVTSSGTIIAAVTAIEPLGIKKPLGENTKQLRVLLDKEILGQ